jgi:hypothetical protein
MKEIEKKTKRLALSKPEKVTAAEALTRMKNFTRRKEKMIAFIIESKN